jgi:hypothetical protein
MAHIFKYIGKVNVENVRTFILENTLTDEYKIAMHPQTFDEFAIDYLKAFTSGIPDPFKYLGIDIIADNTQKTPKDRIMVADGETIVNRVRIIDLPPDPKLKKIYRCGYCGGIVGYNGDRIPEWEAKENERIVKEYRNRTETVMGSCCIEQYHKDLIS